MQPDLYEEGATYYPTYRLSDATGRCLQATDPNGSVASGDVDADILAGLFEVIECPGGGDVGPLATRVTTLEDSRQGWEGEAEILGGMEWHNGCLQSGSGALITLLANTKYYYIHQVGTGNLNLNDLLTIGFVKLSGVATSITLALYELGQTLPFTFGDVLHQEEITGAPVADGKLKLTLPAPVTFAPGARIGIGIECNSNTAIRAATAAPRWQRNTQSNLNPFFRGAGTAGTYTPESFVATPAPPDNAVSVVPLIIGTVQ